MNLSTTKLIFLLICFLANYLIGNNKAFAFPDTLRHGYTNCTTCHVSPSGGGLLSAYGRSLSSELMSTWSYKDEEQPLEGLVKIPESIMDTYFFGGDSRYLSRKTEGKSIDADEGFLMQAQLRLGFAIDKVKFIGAFGTIENPRESSEIKLVSPEYYLLWNVKEEIHFRAGRFEPIYGLRMPDHNLWIKTEIGYQPWIQRDTVEAIYEGEKQFANMAGFQSTSATSSSDQITGYTASFYQILGEKSRVGLSAMNSEGQGVRMKSFTLHSTVSFSEKSYSLFEYSSIWNNDTIKDAGFLRLGYEIFKGFTPILQGQAKIDRDLDYPEQYKTGAGFIWLPRPHFEIMGTFEQLNNAKENYGEALLLLHYYL